MHLHPLHLFACGLPAPRNAIYKRDGMRLGLPDGFYQDALDSAMSIMSLSNRLTRNHQQFTGASVDVTFSMSCTQVALLNSSLRVLQSHLTSGKSSGVCESSNTSRSRKPCILMTD